MAYSDKWKEKVDKVSQTIDDAVGTNDFSNLSHKVTDLLDQARKNTIHALGGKDAEESSDPDEAEDPDETEEEYRRQEARRREQEHKLLVKQCFAPPVSTNVQKTEMYAGIALAVFVALISIVLPPLWIIFIFLLVGIINRKKKTQYYARYNRYRDQLVDHFYADISYLAQSVQQSKEQTIRDLKKMMGERLFREGHFDQQKTCFIASDDAYQQYLITQRHYAEDRIRRAEEQTEADINNEADEETIDPHLPSEVRQMLEEGRDYVSFLQKVNDEIDDETVSAKLDRMTTIVSRIFVELKRKPEKAGKLHPFESYYMPTTKKLLTSYVSLSEQPVQSPKIVKAEKEIEDSLDPINDAFETLLDSLFGDIELDVASDISVMKSMMKQDGLMPDDFEKDK